ncbi:NADH dehydrogenase, FAD-containing subunit [Halalkaliarchaeum sp. AArc-CO]|uniref:NAD(P)/FAD-dependent oxidoreductase n=1 Tax=Halalkaliarchaeum sp. AArc-CO TaxID=2866381 RepID=UPI00217D3324|nr:NAD(P)/FAD-dependent oxidoreductase [Halalkaliarchaeum sp. AArc-CO]UWG50391.1 NADH dehydrogenase, FAD-containing subunit [Halalkaliarchaeum sp. AArc-CO]
MGAQVVVVGSGYAGAGAVTAFEDAIRDDEAELTWISDHEYHLVLHEVHRVIRDPDVAPKITIPVSEIKSDATDFLQGRVTGIDTDERTVSLGDGRQIAYDYLLVGVGSGTAFYGIEGLEEHSFTLKGLEDARRIHREVTEAGERATRAEPARVIVGGAGLSGIQTAGEIATYCDETQFPIEVTLVEGLDEVFPGKDPEVQRALRERLEALDVEIRTGRFVSAVDDDAIRLDGQSEEDDGETLPYDVLVWTGGVTGQDLMAEVNVEKDERSRRVYAESDFQTSDDRVFAIGDAALVDQGDGEFAPPTAQAAWQAAEVAGENLARTVRGEPLQTWKHTDKGTVVSVGETAVAHDVQGVPVSTFGGVPAKVLKKLIAARWIYTVSSARRSVDAWPDM